MYLYDIVQVEQIGVESFAGIGSQGFRAVVCHFIVKRNT